MMTYLEGLKDFFSGFRLIFNKGARRFVIAPLLINISLFSAAVYLLISYMESWLDSLLPTWLSWLAWLIWPIFMITVLLIVFYSFTLMINLIAAPFNSLLATRIEAIIAGKQPVNTEAEKIFSLAFLNLTVRSVGAEVHKMFYFTKWLIPLAIITLIPVVNIISPFCWFIFAAWSLALEYTDYPLANHGMLFSEVRQYNRDNRMRALGMGTGVLIMSSLPVLNFLAMPVAVAGATRLTLNIQET